MNIDDLVPLIPMHLEQGQRHVLLDIWAECTLSTRRTPHFRLTSISPLAPIKALYGDFMGTDFHTRAENSDSPTDSREVGPTG